MPSPFEGMALLLASRSPRRAQLLSASGFDFEFVEPGDEPAMSDAPAETQCVDAARAKAQGARVDQRSGILLAVDTVVSLDGRALGKPRDRAEAGAFLELLSGREHDVLTAHAHARVENSQIGPVEVLLERAQVAFRLVAAEERQAYLDRGDWQDKAGGYGIQSDASVFARLVGGEIDTVIGLSLAAVRRILGLHGGSGHR